MIYAIIQILAGLIYGNFAEYIWHKYVFHGLGKKKNSRFRSHWKEHHRDVRKSKGYDKSYETLWGAKREIFELLFAALIHSPLFLIAPYFAGTLVLHAMLYFYIHRKSHLDIEWAKQRVPWHYDHHMGKDQDKNWCVTFPLWDYILGTRVKR